MTVVTGHGVWIAVLLEHVVGAVTGRVEVGVALGVLSGGDIGCGAGGEEVCFIAKVGVVS